MAIYIVSIYFLFIISLFIRLVIAANSKIDLDQNNTHSRNVTHSIYNIPICCALNFSVEGRINCADKDSVLPNPPEKDGYWVFPDYLMNTAKETSFKLKIKEPACTLNSVLRTFYTRGSGIPFRLQQDGFLVIAPENATLNQARDYFNTNQYCIYGFDQNSIEFLTCNASCAFDEPCIKKCCPLDSVVTKYKNKWTCIPGMSSMSPNYYEYIYEHKNHSKLDDWVNFEYNGQLKIERMTKHAFYFQRDPLTWKNQCKGNIENMFDENSNPFEREVAPLTARDGRMYYVLENGEILYKTDKQKLASSDYSCIDAFKDYENRKNLSIPAKQMVIFECEEDINKPLRPAQIHRTHAILSIVSSVFALITVFVYFLLWDKNNNAYGWTFITFCLTVFLLYLFTGFAHLMSDDKERLEEIESDGLQQQKSGCRFLAMASHFFFIAMFSWLAMLSLDLWLTFRSITDTGDIRTKHGLRYFCYSFFAWGIPLLEIALSHVFLNKTSNIQIQLNAEHCLTSIESLWEFLYVPMIILFCLILLFFILTTRKLIEYKRCTEFTINAIPNGKIYTLFAKLMTVFVFFWVIKVVSWIIREEDGLSSSWQTLFTINCLLPVAIFFIYVVKWDILNGLAEKSSILNCLLTPMLWVLSNGRLKPYAHSTRIGHHDEEINYDAETLETAPLSSSSSKPLNYSQLSNESEYWADDDVQDTQNN